VSRFTELLLGRSNGKAVQKAELRYYPYENDFDVFTFNGIQYPIIGTYEPGLIGKSESSDNFIGYVRQTYKTDGVVFACMLARQMIFSEARFQFQRMRNGRPDALFATPALAPLETPWPNGTTGELLSRMVQDVDLAGNFYAVQEGRRIRRLRPDWVEIVLTAAPEEAVASDVAGYLYRPGGPKSQAAPVTFDVDEVIHWSPIPDPEAQYRGMSWITPVLREIDADKKATQHKLNFFNKGATLQTVVAFSENVTEEQFKKFMRTFRETHQSTRNAYEPLFLGMGADAKVIGTDLRQLDFKATQGAGETRIAADSGIHPVILGLSEGLAGSSLNAGNFNAARRLTADKTYRPLWRSACAAVAPLVQVPPGARLWYDDRDIPFLREDRTDLANIQATEAQSIRTLLDAGCEFESVVAAIDNQDWTLLEHTGLFSVQLQPPMTVAAIAAEEETEPEDEDDAVAS
jgi:phage portal protein BeeE